MIVALLLIKVHCRLRLWDKFCVSEEASGLIGSETAMSPPLGLSLII